MITTARENQDFCLKRRSQEEQKCGVQDGDYQQPAQNKTRKQTKAAKTGKKARLKE